MSKQQCVLATCPLPHNHHGWQAHHGMKQFSFQKYWLLGSFSYYCFSFNYPVFVTKLCLFVILFDGRGYHTQARHIWLVGIYLFSIMHNNIPVVCQVLFSQASWVKKIKCLCWYVYLFRVVCSRCGTVVSFDNKALVMQARFRRPCASDRQRLKSRASNVTPPDTPPRFHDVPI